MPATTMGRGRNVQVVVTAGIGDPARARLGLEAALAAAASGLQVAVFLTLDATVWACEPRQLGAGANVYPLLEQLATLGAQLCCCSACAADTCGSGGGGPATLATSPGIEILGLAALMERVAAGVPTVTF